MITPTQVCEPDLSRLAAPSRTRVTVREMTAEGFDFRGCDDRNPDICACSTWAGEDCPRCGQEIRDGERIIATVRWTEWDGVPWWLGESDNDYRHVTCPQRSGGDR